MAGQTTDLVIVGGGLAGLVSGARAGELGLDVLVLERGESSADPCNARWSGGVLHIACNDALTSGTLAQRTPARTAGKHETMPIATPPFHALPVCAGITYTMGGIAVDGNARSAGRPV